LNFSPSSSGVCLHQFVQDVVKQYLVDMDTTPPDNLYQVIIAEVERPLIQAVLEHTGGNQSRAADMLGITRTTLRNRIQRYGLESL
jgi:Fis family transcriptional regulator, factor for inversion stimulation protein